jgi:hypothetical protein
MKLNAETAGFGVQPTPMKDGAVVSATLRIRLSGNKLLNG